MRFILACLLLCLTWSASRGTEILPSVVAYDYNIKEMALVLEKMKSYETLPEFANQDSDEIVAIQENLDSEIFDLFYQTQEEIFGKTLIALKFCADCGIIADFPGKNIYVQPSEIQRILDSKIYADPKNVIKFIFAHEISHFVHEISCHPPFSKKDFVSMNGLSSAYVQELSPLAMLQSHSEVDIYAALAMKKNNFSGWSDVFLFYIDEIMRTDLDEDREAAVLVKADFQNRLFNIQKYLEKTN